MCLIVNVSESKHNKFKEITSGRIDRIKDGEASSETKVSECFDNIPKFMAS